MEMSRRRTKVTILATQKLTGECLNVLLQRDRELTVVDVAVTKSDLLDKLSETQPDVVLICLMDNEGKNIDVITDVFRIAPHTKVVILSGPNSSFDQPASLKLGVTGIVGTNQNVKVLVRAIRRVSEGGVWLNQKLIEHLVGGILNGGNGTISEYSKAGDLTGRELEVVKMVALGLNNKDASKKLSISEATVRHHLSSVYGKLHVEDRLNLAIYAYQRGIVAPPGKSKLSLGEEPLRADTRVLNPDLSAKNS